MTSQSLRFTRGIVLPFCGAGRFFSLSFCAIALSFAASAQVTQPQTEGLSNRSFVRASQLSGPHLMSNTYVAPTPKVTYLPDLLGDFSHVQLVLVIGRPQGCLSCLPSFASLLGGGLAPAITEAVTAGFSVGQIAALPYAGSVWAGATTQAQIAALQAAINAANEAAEAIEVVVEVLADII